MRWHATSKCAGSISTPEAQLECRCDELAALIALVRRNVAAARESARFDARA
jgi:hypothetical protein